MRFPSRYIEPEFARKFRQWKNEWEVRTGNKLNIADGLAYLRSPGHFLPSIEEREKRERFLASEQGDDDGGTTRTTASKLNVKEIDQLLASEGIPGIRFGQEHGGPTESDSQSGRPLRKTEQQQSISDTAQWLVVKYRSNPNLWTLPFTNRMENETAFSALMRVCKDQIGLKPHLPSLAPIAFRDVQSLSQECPNTRMFYYKGLKVPRSHEVSIPEQSEIVQHEWVSRDELRKRLSHHSWLALENALPLD